jgi:hypothetical protein
MRLVMNHVTRMGLPRICVAGIEPVSGEHVRPTTPRWDPITRDLLRSEGGPFGPGAIVELGDTTSDGTVPEVEDRLFATANVEHVEDMDAEDYLGLLDRVKDAGVEAAFGQDLIAIRPRKLAVPQGRGHRSLAVVRLADARLDVAPWGSLYLKLDGEIDATLRVTDARFYGDDHKTVDSDLVVDVNRRLARGTDAYAMLGLARPLEDEDGGWVHWLQCNGVCLADRAVSDVP